VKRKTRTVADLVSELLSLPQDERVAYVYLTYGKKQNRRVRP
jgi:hypothetical protein